MTTLRAYVFDAYGTLFDVHSIVDAAERAFPGSGKTLSQSWRARQLEYTWLRSLIGSYVDFWRITQDALGYACQALNLECSVDLQARLMDEYLSLATFPEVDRALDSLSSGTLAILSNGSPRMLSEVVAHAGLSGRFSQVISVDEVRIYKPSPRVYELAPIRLGIPKEEIGFVTSNYFDVAGAKAFGFYVYWVNRTAAPADRLGLAPDEVISLLTDIHP
jgi:2-haloacid dehalogenase